MNSDTMPPMRHLVNAPAVVLLRNINRGEIGSTDLGPYMPFLYALQKLRQTHYQAWEALNFMALVGVPPARRGYKRVDDAARAMGISTVHFYRLIKAALEAIPPDTIPSQDGQA